MFRTHSRIAVLAVLLSVALSGSADALRLMTFNILNYSSGREADFRTVIADAQPDVLVVQEILSQSGVDRYLSQVLNTLEPGEWAAGPFVNGYDTDNGIFYRTSSAQFISHYVVGTALRDIDEWTIRPAGVTSPSANVRLYVVHLKASQGSSNQAKRLAEVTAMRTRMETFPAGETYCVIGDFNIYYSSESAYQYMLSTGGGTAGVVQDPISSPGNWHNNAGMSWIHTQSPRTTQFGGGANGGMDDRFDIILVSPAFQDGQGWDVLPATYTSHGNDGLHYNVALTDPPTNGVVPQAVAQAIHDCSDHLPVYVDLEIPAVLSVPSSLNLGRAVTGGSASADLAVANAALPPADDLDYSLSSGGSFSAPGGSFVAAAGVPGNAHAVALTETTPGDYAGSVTVTSDDPDHPAEAVALSGTVVAHARPSTSAGSETASESVDFGVQLPGAFLEAAALVHNFGYGSLQALLEVDGASLTGDPRFSLVAGSVPQTVGGSPALWSVEFDGSGAPGGLYEASLTLSTRDEPGLSGATGLSDVVWNFTVTISGDGTGVELETGPTRAGFVWVAPNPFRADTGIQYGLEQPGAVSLQIHDIAGRLVRTLVKQSEGRGDHTVRWDGRDARHRMMAPGIYFARLTTPDGSDVRRIVRIR